MELLGETVEAPYVLIHAKKPEQISSDGAEVFLCPKNDVSRYQVPWRSATYGLKEMPKCFPEQAGAPDNRNAVADQPAAVPAATIPHSAASAGNNNQPPCYSQRQQGNNIFFPYSRKLIAGRLEMQAETESRQNDFRKNVTAPKNPFPPPQFQPTFSRDPHLPMTPALGRSAQLQEYLAQHCGNSDIGHPQPTYPRPPRGEHQPASPMDIEQQTKHTNKIFSSNNYNSPMSHFPNDHRYLKNAFRAFKRDEEILKDRNQFNDPNRFRDEGHKDWYNYMTQDNPTADPRTESALVNSGCTRVPDGFGGYSYICPNRCVPPADTSVRAMDPICYTYQPSRGGDPTSPQKVIDTEINATIKHIQNVTSTRDSLYDRLLKSEQPLHEVKEQLYSLPIDQRCQAKDLIRKMSDIERDQGETVKEIRNKGIELTHLLKHQHDLEVRLANQVLEDARQTSLNVTNNNSSYIKHTINRYKKTYMKHF
ncbi:uncharacterized protein LOC131944985 [Physella acuta]|uniref:uncharacterized protein LOC131944985 n=1 Tax=Physella acuta TaxID=109671 RepID=UPI0027DB7229|nr:uncharacterized protein LOC131944985 [Physella acuta]